MNVTNYLTYEELREDILHSRFASSALKIALLEFDKRDPLDAMGDSEVLLKCFSMRWEEAQKKRGQK